MWPQVPRLPEIIVRAVLHDFVPKRDLAFEILGIGVRERAELPHRLPGRYATASPVSLPKAAVTEVPFAIALPRDATPGDYVGGIVSSLKPGGSDADQRAGIQIRLRVGGALKPSLAVSTIIA